MSLSPGARLGPYEIVSPLGAGGMGEVYKARDARLDRVVAIKVLPAQLASDPAFRDRFDREARTLSQLDHPHICALHDVGHDNGLDYLVMQYLEGETLAERLSRGALPVDLALKYAIEIADALDKAHRAGVVHRDLKPGNIMLTKAGSKLLDFGLAKAAMPAAAGGVSMLPTTPPGLTVQGTILGTFQYMAPEQLEGLEADARTDIFAFGAVLYEMLTAKQAFHGKSHASLIAAILEHDPPPVSTVQPLTPPALDRVIATCLSKDPDKRWQSAGDLARELTWVATAGGARVGGAQARVAPAARRLRLAWGVAGLVAGLLIGGIATALIVRTSRNSARQAPEITRVLIAVTPADQLRAAAADQTASEGHLSRTAMALSPDGRTLVFSAVRGNQQQLYARALDQLQATPIAGTDNGANPFFSPDGRWVGFWADGALKKVSVAGGGVTTVCQTPAMFGASWGQNDLIVFGGAEHGTLWQVSASGGMGKPLTMLDLKRGEVSHRLPQVLPGNQAVIFTVTRTNLPTWDDTDVVVQSLTTGERKMLVEGAADARYLPTGHLVYVRRGTLMAVAFDLQHLTVGGGAATVIGDLMQSANMTNTAYDSGAGQFSISNSGSLAYVQGGMFTFPERLLVWVNRSGGVERLPAPPRAYIVPRLSPDGKQVLVSTQGDRNVWVYDTLRGTTSRLTVDGRNLVAVWTPDGKRVTFGSSTVGTENLFWKPADGSGSAERLTTSPHQHRAAAWSPDGRTLVFVETGDTPDVTDILAISPGANSQPTAVVKTRFTEAYPDFSPDGRWLAYASNESGRSEVYVQPYPGPGPRIPVSAESGTAPRWGAVAKELFYLVPAVAPGVTLKMMAVPITIRPTFTAGRPQVLFESPLPITAQVRGYDVTPDGQRFLTTQAIERPPIRPTQMVLVQNWFEELKRQVPPN